MKLSDKFKIIIPPQDIACDPRRLEKLANGDREAYAWVYKNYCKKIYDYAFLMTNNEQVSEDIVQEVFLKLWVKREKLKEVKDFNGYLYMMYRSYILNVLTKQKKESGGREVYSRNVATEVIKPDEIISKKEKEQSFILAVKNLPQQQQLVFRLRRDHGWKTEKIAEKLKISPFTVKNHIQKALKSLKERVK